MVRKGTMAVCGYSRDGITAKGTKNPTEKRRERGMI